MNVPDQASTAPKVQNDANATADPAGSRAAAIAMYGVLLLAYSVNAADRQLFPLLAHDVRVQ